MQVEQDCKIVNRAHRTYFEGADAEDLSQPLYLFPYVRVWVFNEVPDEGVALVCLHHDNLQKEQTETAGELR